jgi:Putative peptidoglycan binding domain
MKKIIKLTESDLHKIVTRVLNEQLANVVNTPEEIMDFQKKLVKLGYKIGRRGPLKNGVDGKLGKLTKGAIASFQKASKLPITGKLDQITQNKINNANSVNYESSTSEWNQKLLQFTQKQSSQSDVEKNNSKMNYRYSPRIDAELKYIKQRQSLWDRMTEKKPFFIYDPKFNLIYLFNNDFSLIKSSQVVDGKDKQGKGVFTVSDWCKKSNLEDKPYRCTDPKTKQKKDPYYYVLDNEKIKFLPQGIYSISRLGRHEGYSGKGKNIYTLKNPQGVEISQAIHGIPDIGRRLEASQELADLLMADKNKGKVPQQYLNAVDTVIASANLSYGCIGIPASFVEDPEVISVVKEGIPVYVMGESEKGFLVQNSNNYFNRIGSDDGSCVNPESVAQSMGSLITTPNKPNYSSYT